jgi:glutamate-1-semialdehyde 2,1-aminomutase
MRAHLAQFGSVVVPYFMEPPVESYTDLLRNDSKMDVRFRAEMVKRGIFMLPMALKRNHLTMSHSQDDVARTLNAAEDVLQTISRS